jgi:hypothetical protein
LNSRKSIVKPRELRCGKQALDSDSWETAEERILHDSDSIVPSGPRSFRVWIMGFDANGFPRKSREEFDCVNKIVRDVEVISEKPNKPVHHTFTPSDWHGVVRETPRGELFKTLCR